MSAGATQVRAALVRVMSLATDDAVVALAESLGVYETMRGYSDIADALLALSPHGEPGEADDALFKLRRAINGLRVSEATSTDEVAWADEIEGRLDAYLALRARPAPVVTEAMVEAGVNGWIGKINESHSLARMEHEMGRDEIVRHILTAALAAPTTQEK